MLGNAGTLIAFRVGVRDAEVLSRELEISPEYIGLIAVQSTVTHGGDAGGTDSKSNTVGTAGNRTKRVRQS